MARKRGRLYNYDPHAMARVSAYTRFRHARTQRSRDQRGETEGTQRLGIREFKLETSSRTATVHTVRQEKQTIANADAP
eukprot:scaffold14591_cov140-Isochrysis_galbana.AAC.7